MNNAINMRRLATMYGVHRDTVKKYVTKNVADPKNPTMEEVRKLEEDLSKVKHVKMSTELHQNMLKDLQSDAKVEFADESSSISLLLQREREDYNYFLKCLEVDKQKVQALENSKDDSDMRVKIQLIQTYKKELREDKKTLLAIGARITELEKQLALTEETEDRVIDDE